MDFDKLSEELKLKRDGFGFISFYSKDQNVIHKAEILEVLLLVATEFLELELEAISEGDFVIADHVRVYMASLLRNVLLMMGKDIIVNVSIEGMIAVEMPTGYPPNDKAKWNLSYDQFIEEAKTTLRQLNEPFTQLAFFGPNTLLRARGNSIRCLLNLCQIVIEVNSLEDLRSSEGLFWINKAVKRAGIRFEYE